MPCAGNTTNWFPTDSTCAIVVAKLLPLLLLFPRCNFVLVISFVPVVPDGMSLISPNNGSERILTCLSINVTRSLNRALHLDVSSIPYAVVLHRSLSLNGNLEIIAVAWHIQLLHVLRLLHNIAISRKRISRIRRRE